MPEKWGGDFTEGCAWHYTWSVFHDPQGLIDLMGGRQAFVDKLDAVFSTPPIYDCSYYGFPIHEIVEMTVMNMGQYAHGNQPIQHMIYLYNYAGQPWKAQKWVREVMERLYTDHARRPVRRRRQRPDLGLVCLFGAGLLPGLSRLGPST